MGASAMGLRREKLLDRDGWVWCYELTSERLNLRLFRLLPIGSVALRRIVYIRQRGADDMSGLFRDALLKPFKSWYWPHPIMSYHRGHSTPYIIRTDRGARIFVRLRSGFHYRLRDAMGNARFNHVRAEAPVADVS